MKKALTLTVLGGFFLVLAACGSGPTAPASIEPPTAEAPAETAVPPTAEPTEAPTLAPTEAPTNTPIVEEPTLAAASDVVVDGLSLRVVEAAYDKLYKGTFQAVGVSNSKTTLYVIFGFPDGISKEDLEAVEKWDVKIKTAKGYVVSKGGDLSHIEPSPEVIWLFAVPKVKEVVGFTVVFPTGETFLLDPFIQ